MAKKLRHSCELKAVTTVSIQPAPQADCGAAGADDQTAIAMRALSNSSAVVRQCG
jgi:hypothetical protein